MTPEQAVQTNLDLHGRVMLPIHWATFNLAFHAWREPADRAFVAARNAGVTLVIPKREEFVEPGTGVLPREEWW